MSEREGSARIVRWQSERRSCPGSVDFLNPDELVATALAAHDCYRGGPNAQTRCEQPAHSIVRSPLERRGRDAHHKYPVPHPDDLAATRPGLNADRDCQALH
jgi:hypothetical protein